MSSKLSIAVLPFKNISSNNENEYFCDGLTEEIINALAKINGLKVTSRTSSFFFKNKDISISEIGKDLNVSIILEGSIRLSQNKIRITAQLIEAQNDFHFWSETWDRSLENIFEVQDEISLMIADKIRENFGHFELQESLVEQQTESIEAYKNYLKGQHHYLKWNPIDAKLAIKYFEKTISLDEEHAESYCSLSQCYSFLAGGGYLSAAPALLKAEEHAKKALVLNPNIPEVHFGFAGIAFWNEWNIEKALVHIKKTLEINPNFSAAYLVSALAYMSIGKKALALKHINIGLQLDPFSTNMIFANGWISYLAKDYNKALKFLNLALEKDDKFLPAYVVRGCSLLKMGKYDDVLHFFSEDIHAHIDDTTKMGMQGLAYALKKNIEQADYYLAILEDWFNEQRDERALNFIFVIYAVLQRNDLAIEWLNKGIDMKLPNMMLLIIDPFADALEENTKYQSVKRNFATSKLALKGLLNEGKSQLLDEQSIKIYTEKLFNFMNEEQPYLDSNISLKGLASDLELHPNQLSWLINENLGKNFSGFINHYRVETFKSISKDPKNSHVTLLGLAYDSGFNSKTVFNTFFKKETGMTPKQYLKL